MRRGTGKLEKCWNKKGRQRCDVCKTKTGKQEVGASKIIAALLVSYWDYLSFVPSPAEVQIKVQVFDNSDLSPLVDAQVEVHGNQTLLASSRASSDGVVRVGFPYRVGTWVIITASKQDYVTNSVPWHSSRIPCESAAPQRYVQLSVNAVFLPQRRHKTVLFLIVLHQHWSLLSLRCWF